MRSMEQTCICSMEKEGGEEWVLKNPKCPVTGHSDRVTQVEFSHDGARVISASADNSVRFWDVASGRQIQVLEGHIFAFVEGRSNEHKRGRHVLTFSDNMLRVYECEKEQQHAEDGAAAAPVACFMAPNSITSVRCHGAVICAGGTDGAVCILLAPFLTA